MNFSDYIILENNSVLLRPLTFEDEAGLCKIAFDPDIWKFTVSRAMNPEISVILLLLLINLPMKLQAAQVMAIFP